MKSSRSVKTTTFSDVDTIHSSDDVPFYSHRKQKPSFRAGLSPEARKAMELTLAEAEEDRHKVTFKVQEDIIPDKPAITSLQKPPEKKESVRQKSFLDVYEKSASFRLDDDITDKKNRESNPKTKLALDGGKYNGALETVEVVKRNDKQVTYDESEILKNAQKHAVEKCLVWMEVHELADDET